MNRLSNRPVACLATCIAALFVCLSAVVAEAGLESQVTHLLGGADLGKAEISVLIRDLNTGRTLVDLNPDQPMIPASNMKLITTAAALYQLGAEFTFTTRLQLMPGSPQVAQGGPDDPAAAEPARDRPSLVIRGDGDPAFGDPILLAQAGYDNVDDFLDLWIQAIEDTGIEHFDALLIDDRIFDQQFVHPDWPDYDLPRRWCAQVAGLTFYNNVMDVHPIPAAQIGSAPTIELYPYQPNLRTLNRATTKKIDDFQLDRKPGTNQFIFRGSVRYRRSSPFQVTVHDPPMFFADYFKHRLKKAGIQVDRVERCASDARFSQAQTLHAVHTTLPGVLDRTNQDSQNLFAESLLKRMGHQLTSAPGSYQNGTAAVRMFLRDTLGGRLAAVQVADGSGMSRNNLLTARLLVDLLEMMYRDEERGATFTASLSHAGHNGTLQKRLKDLDAQVYAKSGYLGKSAGYASALSGYLVLQEGERPRVYAFSMIFNGFTTTNTKIKNLQDEILGLLEEEAMQAAR
jgi:D-alanyl-D-alanine carboxypeptidase/D-alanyl-D-alanine-endopeptidase (penicillin-binding protein 4)